LRRNSSWSWRPREREEVGDPLTRALDAHPFGAGHGQEEPPDRQIESEAERDQLLGVEDPSALAVELGGLISDLVNQAFDRTSRQRARLDPTPLLVLDEAANTPLRKLPEWASTVAGIGIQLVTVWQSKSHSSRRSMAPTPTRS
jgi:hypothetical protein